MKAPRYFGGWEDFLRAFAMFAREHPELGMQVGRSFERCVEDLIRAEDAIDLRLRDLHREIEELEDEITRLTR
jgi:hypothetical protein